MTDSGKKNIFSSLFSNKKTDKTEPAKKKEQNNEIATVDEINKLQKIITSKFIIEPALYDFILAGGPIHTSLLVASAKYNQKSEKAGEPIPLRCRWYNKSEENELKEIEGVRGAYYQPCSDDVGSRIYVEAFPVTGSDDYEGSPKTAEVGPLTLDPLIDSKVQAFLDEKKGIFNAKIDSVNFETEFPLDLPSDCEIELDINSLDIFVEIENKRKKLLTCALGDQYPFVLMIKRSNNVFDVNVSSKQYIRLAAKSNIERDIITMAIRLFCGQKRLWELQPSESSAVEEGSNYESVDEEAQNHVKNHDDSNKEKGKEEGEQVEDEEKCALSDTQVNPQNLEKNPDDLEPSPLNGTHNLDPFQRRRNSSMGSDPSNEIVRNRKESDIENKFESPPGKKEERGIHDEFGDSKQLTHSGKGSKKYAKRGTCILPDKLNYDVYIKIEQLSKEVYRISNEKDKLSKELEKSEEAKLSMSKKLEETREQLNNCTKNYYEISNQCENLKNNIEAYKTEKIFFHQEINLANSEKQKLEHKIEELNQRIEGLEKDVLSKNDVNQEELIIHKESGQIYREEMQRLQEEMNTLLKQKDEAFLENEQLQNEKNYYKRKYESLVQEKMITLPEISNQEARSIEESKERQVEEENPEQDVFSAGYNNYDINIDDYLEEKKKEVPLEEEVKKLKQQVKLLELTIETFKFALENNTNKKTESKKFRKQSTANSHKNTSYNHKDIESLQKLANSLTEVITDKDLALENQKIINKALIRKIRELEEKIKFGVKKSDSK